MEPCDLCGKAVGYETPLLVGRDIRRARAWCVHALCAHRRLQRA